MNGRLALCFVLMPFGRKLGPGGVAIDFEAVYGDLVAPAIAQAGLQPWRGGFEQAGGLIHKPTFERLTLSEYVLADLTLANANVGYELGVRNGVRNGVRDGERDGATVFVFAQGAAPTALDSALLRALPYRLDAGGRPSRLESDRAALVSRLEAARTLERSGSVYPLVDDFPDIQRLKTDVFRAWVDYSQPMKERLRDARSAGPAAVHAFERDLTDAPTWVDDTDAAVLVDLYLSYRAVKDWPAMIALAGRMPPHLAATTLVQEQLGFAFNRAGRPDDAEATLKAVITCRGPSSETCSLLGRVYKDRWEAALRAHETLAAKRWLEQAIESYLRGFQADWRDAFPGVNAVTLMELKEPADPRGTRLIPVVAFAVERRIAAGSPDYWDHATLLELAVLARDEKSAVAALHDALAAVREKWEPESTARNLRLVREVRDRRGQGLDWAAGVEAELDRRAS